VSVFPLNLQRKFEQWWAARFSQPAPAAASAKQGHEKLGQQFAAPNKAKKKTRGLEAVGIVRILPVSQLDVWIMRPGELKTGPKSHEQHPVDPISQTGPRPGRQGHGGAAS
jgi:hypothetical protein